MLVITQISTWIIPIFLILIIVHAVIKKVPIYETFVEGAKEGIGVMVKILPFLLGMLVAIGIFRESGAFDILLKLLTPFAELLHIPSEVVPLALMRPLSGSGALGITADILTTYGADSYIGRVASVMQGSTDTTFYILTVYFGAVAVTKYRHAVICGLVADLTAFLAANLICSLVFAN